MAKGKKTGGKDFKPGHGIGRPPIAKEVKEASKLTIEAARAKLNEFLDLGISDLELILKERKRPALDLWVCRIVLMGIRDGDERRLDFMLSRLIGPIPKEPVVQKTLQINVANMSEERIIEMGKDAIKYLEEAKDE